MVSNKGLVFYFNFSWVHLFFFSQSILSTFWLQTEAFNAMSYAAEVPGPFLPLCLSICPRLCQGCSSLHHFLAWKNAAHPLRPSSHCAWHHSPSTCFTSMPCAQAPYRPCTEEERDCILPIFLVFVHFSSQTLLHYNALRSLWPFPILEGDLGAPRRSSFSEKGREACGAGRATCCFIAFLGKKSVA